MNVPPKLIGPQGHIYHTDICTWNKAKAYAREHRKAPRLLNRRSGSTRAALSRK